MCLHLGKDVSRAIHVGMAGRFVIGVCFVLSHELTGVIVVFEIPACVIQTIECTTCSSCKP